MENLSPYMDTQDLRDIANEILAEVDRDTAARDGWNAKAKRGMARLGLDAEAQVPEFDGALTARFPLIRQAVVQFNSRTMGELFPPEGPVKTTVLGTPTEAKAASAKRVKQHMNYQITDEDQDWYSQDDKMTMHLAMFGHVFKRTYRDNTRGKQVSRVVLAENVVVPYAATSLASSPRFTHIMPMTPMAVLREQESGLFDPEIELTQPSIQEPTNIQQGIDTTEGTEPSPSADDADHTIYRTYKYLDIEIDHMARTAPYEIYTDRDTAKILAIYQAWDPNDTYQELQHDLTDYVFVPGFGYYGLGYLHLLGDLDEASTDILRTIADGGKFASMQGGFASTDINNGKGVAAELKHGVWQPLPCTAEDLAKGFYTPPFREPSPALFSTLQLISETGKEFAGMTDANLGTAASTGPVGTIVALIEQGGKVYTAIHKRIHQAKRQEYGKLAALNQQYLPAEGGYPYQVEGSSAVVYQTDYSAEIGVTPVSDPNITSPQQRLAVAEAMMAMAERFPQLYDAYEINRRMLEAIRAPEIDRVLKNPRPEFAYDPVTENMGFLVGATSVAFSHQDHQAHLVVHTAFVNGPELQQLAQVNPQAAEMVRLSVTAHMIEHFAFDYQRRIMGEVNMPVQLHPETGSPMIDLPPEVEAQVSQMAAQAAAQAGQEALQLPPPPPSPEELKQAEQAAELEAKQAEHAQELQHKQEEHEQAMAHQRDLDAVELERAREEARMQVVQGMTPQ